MTKGKSWLKYGSEVVVVYVVFFISKKKTAVVHRLIITKVSDEYC